MIYVDIREKRSNIPILFKKIGIEFEFRELPVADYLIPDEPEPIAIERKDIVDFLNSLKTGRLDKQLYELSYNFSLSYIIIVGYISEGLMWSQMRRDALISKLAGISYKTAPAGKQGRIIPLVLETDYDFVLFVKYLLEKVKNKEPRMPKMIKVKWRLSDIQAYILSCVPGLGEKKARILLREFKTLRNIANSPVLTLSKVKGVGKKLAENVYKVFNEEYSEV